MISGKWLKAIGYAFSSRPNSTQLTCSSMTLSELGYNKIQSDLIEEIAMGSIYKYDYRISLIFKNSRTFFDVFIFCGSLSSYLNCMNHIHVCTLKTRQLRIKPLFCLNEEWCGKSTKSSNCFGWCISALFTTFHIYHHPKILRWRFLRELWWIFCRNNDKKVSAIIEKQKFHATVSFIIVIGWRFTIIFFPDNIAAGRFAH